MSIYPQLGSGSPGSLAGISQLLADLSRRVAALSATKTYIGSQAIIGGHVATGAITTGHISAGSIVTSHLTANLIEASHISALAINAGHMQANSITAGNAAIADLTVSTAKIQDLAVLEAKIGNLAVTSAKIGNLAVQTAKIDNLAVLEAKIGNLAVTSAKIADAAIVTAKIGDAQITNAKISNLDGDKINAGTLTADRLVATAASADILLARLTHTGSLVASTGLSAVSANLGTINAGTVTGATIRSGATGARWQGDSTGIRGYNSAGEVTFAFDNATGKITTLAGIGGGNLLLNSSFEDAVTAGWSNEAANSTATTTSDKTHGTRSLLLTKTVSSGVLSYSNNPARPSGVPGKVYTFAYDAKIDAGSDRSWNARIMFYDGAGNVLLDSTGPNTLVVGTGWTRVQHTATAPAGTTAIRVVISSADNHLVGEAVRIDAAQLELGQIATAYAPKPDEILPNTVTGTEIAPNSVRGSLTGGEVHIVPGTIIATDLYVTSLSAITGNMGTLTAGRISGGSIDGNVLDAGSVYASKISVGGTTRSLIANGGFEDLHPTLANFADGWRRYAYNGGGSSSQIYSQVAGGGPGGARSGTREMVLYGGSGASSGKLDSQSVPCSAGEVWALSFWAYQTSPSSPGFYARLTGGGNQNDSNELNSSDPAIEEVTLPGVWTRYTTRFTIPSGWRWCSASFLQWITNTGSYIVIDDVTLQKAVTGTTIVPGAITTNLIAAKAVTANEFNATLGGANKIENATGRAGFQNGTGGNMYLGGPATVSVIDSQGPPSGKSFQLTTTAAGDPHINWGINQSIVHSIPAIPGRPYTASVYGTSGWVRTMRVSVQFLNSSGIEVRSKFYDEVIGYPNFKRISVSEIAPAGTAWVRMYAQFLGAAGAGEIIYFSSPQLEEGDVATAFDAGGSDTGTFTGHVFRTAPSGARVLMDVNGVIKYDSSGNQVVKLGPSDGLDLLASTVTSPPTDRTIRWLRSNGTTAAEVSTVAGLGGGVDGLMKMASQQAAGVTGSNETIIEARKSNGVIKADVRAQYLPGTDKGWVQANAGSWNVTIINEDNQSSFLKNASVANRALDYGVFNYTGNGTRYNQYWVDHNLGRAPSSVIVTTGNAWLVAGVSNFESTRFLLTINHIDAAAWSSSEWAYWAAIG